MAPANISITTFLVKGPDHAFENVSQYEKDESYKKGDAVRNPDDLVTYLALEDIKKAPEKFDPEKWEDPQIWYECEIKQPDFSQLQFAMSSMVKISGNLDMMGFGKAIWDVCKGKCDKEINERADGANNLASLCLELAGEYFTPVDVEIKKN